jgi:hypothetical protein
VPVADIVDMTEDLDDLAKTLGFGAAANTDVDRDEFSEEDLATLVQTRGQSDATDDIPDDIRDRVVDEVETDAD